MSTRTLVILVLAMATVLLGACAPGQTAGPAATPGQPSDAHNAAGPQPAASPTPLPPGPPVAPAVPQAAPPQAAAPQPIVKGMVAPDFTLADLDGVPRSLSDYRGKVVMLNFWASWCGFCRSEIPHMNTVYSELADQGFEIVAVSLGEDPEHLRQFAAENQMEFPILPDVETITVPLYLIRSVPTSYFLDRDGVVQVLYNGAIAEETLRTIVKTLLSQ